MFVCACVAVSVCVSVVSRERALEAITKTRDGRERHGRMMRHSNTARRLPRRAGSNDKLAVVPNPWHAWKRATAVQKTQAIQELM